MRVEMNCQHTWLRTQKLPTIKGMLHIYTCVHCQINDYNAEEQEEEK